VIPLLAHEAGSGALIDTALGRRRPWLSEPFDDRDERIGRITNHGVDGVVGDCADCLSAVASLQRYPAVEEGCRHAPALAAALRICCWVRTPRDLRNCRSSSFVAA